MRPSRPSLDPPLPTLMLTKQTFTIRLSVKLLLCISNIMIFSLGHEIATSIPTTTPKTLNILSYNSLAALYVCKKKGNRPSWSGRVVYSTVLAVCGKDSHGLCSEPPPMLVDMSAGVWIKKAWLPC